MGRGNNSNLVQFLIGLAIMVAGGYVFLQNITVTAGFFTGMNWRVGGVSVGNGLVVIPFIVGIMMLFAKPHKFISKVVTGLGLLIIILSVIMGTRISFNPISGYAYLLMLVGMFGGTAMVLKVVLTDSDGHNNKSDKKRKRKLF